MNQTRYEFVRGPMHEVRSAWLQYSQALPSTDAAHFIPAAGGCFVVLMATNAASSSRWYEAMSLTRKAAPNLRRFKDEFERSSLRLRVRVVSTRVHSKLEAR